MIKYVQIVGLRSSYKVTKYEWGSYNKLQMLQFTLKGVTKVTNVTEVTKG